MVNASYWCDYEREVNWFAELGVTYYIRVSVSGWGTGQFALTLGYP